MIGDDEIDGEYRDGDDMYGGGRIRRSSVKRHYSIRYAIVVNARLYIYVTEAYRHSL